MPIKFFTTFFAYLLAVVVIGALLISFGSEKPLVEYWILLLLPCFGIPILTSVALSEV